MQDPVFGSMALPSNMVELMGHVVASHNMISRWEMKKVFLNMMKRAEKCVDVQGEHFEGREAVVNILQNWTICYEI